VLTVPNGFAYNTSLVPAPINRKLRRFCKADWKGHLITVDPNASIAFLEFWTCSFTSTERQPFKRSCEHFGESDLHDLSSEAQALSAGEGWATLLMTQNTLAPLQTAGASVKFVEPSLTTGPEYALGISARHHILRQRNCLPTGCSPRPDRQRSQRRTTPDHTIRQRLAEQWYIPNFAASSEKARIDSLLNVGPN